LGAGQVIKGWDQGLVDMCIGKLTLYEITTDYYIITFKILIIQDSLRFLLKNLSSFFQWHFFNKEIVYIKLKSGSIRLISDSKHQIFMFFF
jgi:hypothetical protein